IRRKKIENEDITVTAEGRAAERYGDWNLKKENRERGGYYGHYVRIVDLRDDPTFRLFKSTPESYSEFIEDIRSIDTCLSMDSNIDKFLYASTACIYHCNNEIKLTKLKESYEEEKLNTELISGPKAILERENDIEIWGDGKQQRNFLYIEDCIEAVIKLMECDLALTLNIDSKESISIEELAYVAFETIGVSRNTATLRIVQDKPINVNNRISDNALSKKYLNWTPKHSFHEGMKKTSLWVRQKLRSNEFNIRMI
ncbi:8914_t:CDS:2, partial [Funneliformis mosseae]